METWTQLSVHMLNNTKLFDISCNACKNEDIPSDIMYGGYNSETSVLRLSLMMRLKYTHIHRVVQNCFCQICKKI